MSHDNTQRLGQHSPESKLSTGENSSPGWQKQTPKHPNIISLLTWESAQLKPLWKPGHQTIQENANQHSYFQIVLISNIAKTLELGKAWLSVLSYLLYRQYSFHDHQNTHSSYMLIILHPSLSGENVRMYLTNTLLPAVIPVHVRDLASSTQQKQQAPFLVPPLLIQQPH